MSELAFDLSGEPFEVLELETVISRLRAALPPGTPTAVTGAPRFHLIQIPQAPRPGGGS